MQSAAVSMCRSVPPSVRGGLHSDRVTTPVEVYWNRTRKLWSVRDGRSRRVIAHATELCLIACTMHVSSSGRDRVLRSGVRNVHAWIRGTLVRCTQAPRLRRVSYNPFLAGAFVTLPDRSEIHATARLGFVAHGVVWLLGETKSLTEVHGKRSSRRCA